MIGDVVTGALASMAIALMVMVAQSWPTDDVVLEMETSCCFGCYRAVVIESACLDDYSPVPPIDGSWCGVRLDDRYPLRDDSFPTIEIPMASSP